MGASESTDRSERNSSSTEEDNASNGSRSTASKILTVGAAIGAVAIGAYALSSSSALTSESPNHNAQPFSSSSSSSSGSFHGNHQEPKKQILMPKEQISIKCNVDGSVQNDGKAGCGGVFRNTSSDAWILGFSRNLGNLDHCDIMESELWGIITGLTIASEEGFSNVRVESDSSRSVDMVLKGCKENHRYYDLIQKAQSLMKRSWNVEIVHVNREKNKLADWMADHSHKLQAGSQKKFIIPPDGIKNLLGDDTGGVSRSRSVAISLLE